MRSVIQNWKSISSKIEIAIYGALAVRADYEGISEVKQVAVSKKERRKNRMCNMENNMAHLEDMFASYLTIADNMFSGREMADRTKMLNGIREILKLNVSGEFLIDPNA